MLALSGGGLAPWSRRRHGRPKRRCQGPWLDSAGDGWWTASKSEDRTCEAHLFLRDAGRCSPDGISAVDRAQRPDFRSHPMPVVVPPARLWVRDAPRGQLARRSELARSYAPRVRVKSLWPNFVARETKAHLGRGPSHSTAAQVVPALSVGRSSTRTRDLPRVGTFAHHGGVPCCAPALPGQCDRCVDSAPRSATSVSTTTPQGTRTSNAAFRECCRLMHLSLGPVRVSPGSQSDIEPKAGWHDCSVLRIVQGRPRVPIASWSSNLIIPPPAFWRRVA